MKLYRFNVLVRGGYPFPIDMLRYDGLAPYSESDSAKIFRLCDGEHVDAVEDIWLTRVAEKMWKPTIARWESLRWTIIKLASSSSG